MVRRGRHPGFLRRRSSSPPPAAREQIRDFQPDWVLVSSEDLGQVLLREASDAAPGRVVYLAHTPQFFPFGPASWNPNPDGDQPGARLRRHRRHRPAHRGYIERYAGRRPAVIHPPIYGQRPL